jgi:outer membrane protein assembly factor BamB
MSSEGVFACPTCGASLTTEGDKTYVKCGFCGNTVIVPEELRSGRVVPPQMSAPVVMVQLGDQQSYPARRSCSLITILLGVFVLVAVGVAASILAFQAGPQVSIPSAPIRLSTSVRVAGPESTRTATLLPDGSTAVAGAVSATPSPTALVTGFAQVLLSFGDEGTGPGFFQDPRGIAVDNNGSIYVVEYSTGRIQKFDENGKFLKSWVVDGSKGMPTLDLAADRSGNVYAIRGGQIMRYSGADGKLLGKVGNSANFYQDITVLADGGFLVMAVTLDDDLIRLDAQGREISRIRKLVSSQTEEPESSGLDVAVDGLGNLFVLSEHSAAVFKFTAAGKFVNRFGKTGDQPGQFRAPGSIAVDGQGRVYIGDFKGIQVFDSDGTYLDLIDFAPGTGAVRSMVFTDKNVMFVTMGSNKVFKLALPSLQ